MRIGILFGGVSWEHEISIVSAITLKKVLNFKNISFIFLDKNHNFYEIESEAMHAGFFTSTEYIKCSHLGVDNRGFFKTSFFSKKYLEIDLIINLIHGADGEDGTIASLLDFYQIPFIGPRMEASVLSFNKHYTKLFAQSRGVPMLPFEILEEKSKRETSLQLPLIVKPSRLGSSIGVNIVRDLKEFNYALDCAFEYDKEVILEPFVEGVKEYNLAGYKAKDFVFSIIEEPKKKDFLNFENKYLDFSRDEKTEDADIPQAIAEKMRESFKKIYENCFEGALIRCDFFVIDGEVFLNEINPIPGSMANYLFKDFNRAITELYENLPRKKTIPIDYQYIKKIQKAK
ncbi:MULTISPECIES: D-alanine--D-alanine ligase [unclassified Helicobacter]|uniref:D-alanine--D-alanine ligase n=1 Tax=unclassified Helicobacter TaxID=2593540 RepID=UPI000CF0BC39|nr:MULTISPECIES: D-alanine--D-alanine ligase [unclassified Helicobacter]